VNYDRKGRSPFYPGQPVPYELFVGRAAEVERIRRATEAMAELCRESGGLPKLMHLLGEAAYSIVPDGVVDLRSAREAIRAAMAATELPSEQGAGRVNSA
jgi:hypothetical protein